MSRITTSAALALGALLLGPAACSREGTPTSPEMMQPSLSSSPDFDADGDGRLSDTEKATKEAIEDALRAAQKAVEQMAKAARQDDRRAFEALRDDWRAYRDSVKKGLVQASILHRCDPLPRARATRTIGRRGGELRVGPHKLLVPAGALTHDVEITGTSHLGARRGVDFEPHGLQFNKPVRLTLSFDRCTVPAAADVQVVYTGPGNQIVAGQPSLADDVLPRVDAWTDHFSGYVVAIGRKDR